MDSEVSRFPRLFRTAETTSGLTWPTMTFPDQISVWLGRREVRIVHIGRGHTAGDVIAIVPDAGVVFAGDLVEYNAACYCGDAHFTDWPATLDHLAEMQANALVPGRGAALTTPEMVKDGIEVTSDFISTLYGSVQESVAKGRSLKDAFDFARLTMDPKFKSFAIYEHCLPFNVARAYDEARGIEWPVIWTAERDREMWAALQGLERASASSACRRSRRRRICRRASCPTLIGRNGPGHVVAARRCGRLWLARRPASCNRHWQRPYRTSPRRRGSGRCRSRRHRWRR